jgi:hypothetical protein
MLGLDDVVSALNDYLSQGCSLGQFFRLRESFRFGVSHYRSSRSALQLALPSAILMGFDLVNFTFAHIYHLLSRFE